MDLQQKMTNVVVQPGMSGHKSFSGSVQYIGGYDGSYADDKNEDARNDNPIPMGLEVFEGINKLVAHQVVGSDEGEDGGRCVDNFDQRE